MVAEHEARAGTREQPRDPQWIRAAMEQVPERHDPVARTQLELFEEPGELERAAVYVSDHPSRHGFRHRRGRLNRP